jgi:hypothetical protein
LIGVLIGDDGAWGADLIRDAVARADQVLSSLSSDRSDGVARVSRLLEMAPALVDVGVDPAALAGCAVYGVWSGDESQHYDHIRAAFQADDGDDPQRVAVREAGVKAFAAARDRAAERERAALISGEV